MEINKEEMAKIQDALCYAGNFVYSELYEQIPVAEREGLRKKAIALCAEAYQIIARENTLHLDYGTYTMLKDCLPDDAMVSVTFPNDPAA